MARVYGVLLTFCALMSLGLSVAFLDPYGLLGALACLSLLRGILLCMSHRSAALLYGLAAACIATPAWIVVPVGVVAVSLAVAFELAAIGYSSVGHKLDRLDARLREALSPEKGSKPLLMVSGGLLPRISRSEPIVVLTWVVFVSSAVSVCWSLIAADTLGVCRAVGVLVVPAVLDLVRDRGGVQPSVAGQVPASKHSLPIVLSAIFGLTLAGIDILAFAGAIPAVWSLLYMLELRTPDYWVRMKRIYLKLEPPPAGVHADTWFVEFKGRCRGDCMDGMKRMADIYLRTADKEVREAASWALIGRNLVVDRLAFLERNLGLIPDAPKAGSAKAKGKGTAKPTPPPSSGFDADSDIPDLPDYIAAALPKPTPSSTSTPGGSKTVVVCNVDDVPELPDGWVPPADSQKLLADRTESIPQLEPMHRAG